ncbi:MAG: transporter substrate-binding domain-containing protein [SAR324 cluster bacterium]|nr:transporter substrate-binding domain-containing protein [SAR324 cluster bacterium]
MIKKIASAAIIFMASTSLIFAATVSICTDTNIWYPFTFVKDGQSSGLHVDIVTRALQDLGYEVKFEPMPWKQCLKQVELGKVDGVVSASYKDERAEFMTYPEDAKTVKKSRWSISVVEYVVVTMNNDPYIFAGDVKTLPQPVRAPNGYSVIDDLKKEGVEVDAAQGDENNFKKMLRDKKGVVVTIPEVAKIFNKKYKDQFKTHEQPIQSKSYYFTISKKSALSDADKSRIWEQIAKIRDNDEVMEQFLNKY